MLLGILLDDACVPSISCDGAFAFQPYVKVKLLSDAKHRSPVIPRTRNPVWLWDTTVHTRKANVQATTTKPSITSLGRPIRAYKGDDEEEAALHFELFDQDSSVIVRRESRVSSHGGLSLLHFHADMLAPFCFLFVSLCARALA
jgi:hypothetical protein